MLSKLEIFFGKFAIHIIGILTFVGVVCGVGWYVTAANLDAQRSHSRSLETQLEVSNASYGSIRDQFALLTQKLEANQEKALESHALLQSRLTSIVEQDKSRQTLEAYLLSRPATTGCKTPKELADAWSKL